MSVMQLLLSLDGFNKCFETKIEKNVCFKM